MLYDLDKDHKIGVKKRYEYYPYKGVEFLKSYFVSRNAFIQDNIHIINKFDIHELLDTSLSRPRTEEILFETQYVLCNFIRKVFNSDLDNYEYDIVYKLLKRYEVSRKIPKYIENQLGSIENVHNILDNYSLLSILLLNLFKWNGNYQLLSTALKLNDLLSGQQYDTGVSVDLVYAALTMEIEIISDLLLQKNVEI